MGEKWHPTLFGPPSIIITTTHTIYPHLTSSIPTITPSLRTALRFIILILLGTMSFGFGISDCVLFVRGLWKITTLLRGEAVEGYRRYETMYHQLAGVAANLQQFVREASEQDGELFSQETRNIRRLLKRFYSSIEGLKPHLSRQRRRHSLLGAIEKIRWPIHSDKLSQLYQDIMSQFQIMTLLKHFHVG